MVSSSQHTGSPSPTRTSHHYSGLSTPDWQSMSSSLLQASGGSCSKSTRMASTPEYLEYVLDLLAGVPEVSSRKMMGEYLLYASGRLFGGVYDDRFLVKDTEASRAVLPAEEVPYEGASPMLLVDIEDAEAVSAMVEAMLSELPEPKKRRR